MEADASVDAFSKVTKECFLRVTAVPQSLSLYHSLRVGDVSLRNAHPAKPGSAPDCRHWRVVWLWSSQFAHMCYTPPILNLKGSFLPSFVNWSSTFITQWMSLAFWALSLNIPMIWTYNCIGFLSSFVFVCKAEFLWKNLNEKHFYLLEWY